MRPSLFRILALTAIFGLVSPLGAIAQETGVTAKLHPWGLFDPGAWKIVRVVTETLNDQGLVVSTCTTNSKTTLMDIDDDGVTLEIQACLEVAGKRFEPEPQIVKQGFHGELLTPGLKQKPPTDGEVTIEGRKISCRVQRLECVIPNGKIATTLYYSTTAAPYILKRKSATTDPEVKDVFTETNVDVIAFNMPLTIRGERRNGIRMKTVRKNAKKGTVTTWADVLPEVPGGVVGNNSKELDETGRLVRRSTLELIDYGVEAERERTGPFSRRRPPRSRGKTPPRHGP